jgi:BirA family biotin operon repressor/biotin-[acetyl-CoA-carboxylase] ligase
MVMMFTPQNIIRLHSVGSTNLYLAELLSNHSDTPEGTVVIAFAQTQGLGMEHNKWLSEAGKNLTCSILLNHVFLRPDQQFILNKIISLSVYDLVKSFIIHEQVNIKWPNDIYIQDKKVAGILISNTIEGNKFIHSIVGIGININQEKFPVNLPNPISFVLALREKTDVEMVFSRLLSILENRYNQLKNNKLAAIHDDYLNALYRLNEQHFYLYRGKKISAEILGVSPFGHLQFLTSDSAIIECDLKEIEFII